jgi:hypothetical protein
MLAELPVMLETVGPCVIFTALSLPESIGFCAKATGAESISPKPNSVSVRFILFFPSKKKYLDDFCDEAALLVKSAPAEKA